MSACDVPDYPRSAHLSQANCLMHKQTPDLFLCSCSTTKNNFRDEIFNNFKMVATEHYAKQNHLMRGSLVELHKLHIQKTDSTQLHCHSTKYTGSQNTFKWTILNYLTLMEPVNICWRYWFIWKSITWVEAPLWTLWKLNSLAPYHSLKSGRNSERQTSEMEFKLLKILLPEFVEFC